ncbi:hypothetical protein BC941DRAFT_448029 [Chlamydoabsidia padenii]|nr:hypothetical protein BC941DRAFT_448029 [Chlamydoabsidia padenii]
MDDLLDLDWSNNASSSRQSTSGTNTSNQPPKDAFADLLSFGSSSSKPPPSLNQQRLNQQQQQQQKYHQNTTVSPISRIAPSSSPVQPSALPFTPLIPSNTSSTSTARNTLDDLLDPFGKSKPKSTGNVPLNTLRSQSGTGEDKANNPWNFDLLAPDNSSSTATTSNGEKPSPTVDPFDMDSLMNATKTPTLGHTTTSYMDNDEENPLGLLAEPVPIKKPSPPPSIAAASEPAPKEPSPEPHDQHHDGLLAQLVDMGFGVEESQVALEESGNVDLQSAIDIIVQQTEAMRRQQQEQQREESKPTTPDTSTSPETAFQQQKERLVSQASELGGYFYKNASLLVRSGKQKISKVMEDYKEQQQPGRPKWMTDVDMESVDESQNGSMEKFVDSDDDDDDTGNRLMMEQMEQERRHLEALRQKQQREQQKQRQQKPVFRSRLLQDDDDEEEETYVSPSRRRQQQPSTPPPSKPAPKPAPPPPKPATSRSVVEASSINLTSATNHRQKGNALYKLGQFADAEIEYTHAIDQLPSGHDHLILLGNNRAMTRLKTGHYKQCIEDCDVVLDLTAAIQHGTIISQGGIEIIGRDHTIKALYRKSEAFEHLEKYQQALDTYHELIKWEGTTNSKVNQAMARCRRILQPPPQQKKPTTTTAPRQRSTNGYGDSKAVSAMRAQAAQQEADDAERLAKTDQVNDKLAKWKQGKESNLRALLATLDTVIWADANWKSIQISELIQPKKCKINYLKAIGKVHPDKLPSSVTVEQRMIASGVFSTLNEAWDSFKTENNL